MRHLTKLLAVLGFVLVGTMLMAASASAQEAKVLKKLGAGNATITVNGATNSVGEGTKIPVGAVIKTDGNSELYIETLDGAVSTVKKNTTIALEILNANQAQINLTMGDVVSQLDHNRLVNKTYGVRTPKGVASARGTTYAIKVNGVGYTVITGLNGQVTITGGPSGTVVIDKGGVSVDGISKTSAQMTDADKAAVKEAATAAATAVAVVAADPGKFGTTNAANAGGELTATMGTIVNSFREAVADAAAAASAAAPSQASNIVKAAVNATTNAQDALDVAKTVSESAAKGSAQGDPGNASTNAADIAKTATETAINKGADATNTATAVTQSTLNGSAAGGQQVNATTVANGSTQGAQAAGQTVDANKVVNNVQQPEVVVQPTTPNTPVNVDLVSPSH